MREDETSKGLAAVLAVRSSAPSKHRGDPQRSANAEPRRKPWQTGRMTGLRSTGFDDGGIAVRAHRHLPWGVCDSRPLPIHPRRPKRLDWIATGEPGPQQLRLAGGARTQGDTGPNGDRALGRGGVGEKGVREAREALRTADSHGWNAGRSMAGGSAARNSVAKNSMAGNTMAMGNADGGCRCGFSSAYGQGPQAFGSGHCLQSRISHDSFLVGYDWWIELWVLRWSGPDGPVAALAPLYITTATGMSRAQGRSPGACRAGPVRDGSVR